MHGPTRRVLIAGHLSLDAPLQGFAQNTESRHKLLRDATLAAFEHLIEGAIEQAVDAVVLNGKLFSTEPTLRSCATFRDGIEALIEEGVQVLWSVQESSELELLKRLRCLPRGLKILTDQQRQQPLLDLTGPTRDGLFNSIACVRLDEWPADATPSQNGIHSPLASDGQSVLQIGLTDQPIGHWLNGSNRIQRLQTACPIVISGGPHRRQTNRHEQAIYHSPGCLQCLDDSIHGSCSATLLQIDSHGEVDLQILETSIVRRESLELSLNANQTLDVTLAEAESVYLDLLADLEHSPTRLLSIRWQVRGPVEQIQRYSREELTTKFEKLFDETDQGIPVLHAVELVPLMSGEVVPSHEFSDEHLETQFLQQLGEGVSNWNEPQQQRQLVERLTAHLNRSTQLNLPGLLAGLNQHAVSHRAAELGVRSLSLSSKAG